MIGLLLAALPLAKVALFFLYAQLRKKILMLPQIVTLILANNVSQKEGETHYNLAHDPVFVGADRLE
jgi:hypothetical protein